LLTPYQHFSYELRNGVKDSGRSSCRIATLKMRMGATHFPMKRLPNVATEMALNVLNCNLTRVLNIVGVKPLLAAMRHRFRAMYLSHCLIS